MLASRQVAQQATVALWLEKDSQHIVLETGNSLFIPDHRSCSVRLYLSRAALK